MKSVGNLFLLHIRPMSQFGYKFSSISKFYWSLKIIKYCDKIQKLAFGFIKKWLFPHKKTGCKFFLLASKAMFSSGYLFLCTTKLFRCLKNIKLHDKIKSAYLRIYEN